MPIAATSWWTVSARICPSHIIRRSFSWRFSGAVVPLRAGLFSRFKNQLLGHNLAILNLSMPLKNLEMGTGAKKVELFWRGTASDNLSLIEFLQENGTIKSDRIAHVMKELDRGLFAPQGEFAYVDSPLPIGYNATISAPHMHAACLELLENHLQPGSHALDVGSGTGYLTGALALLIGDQGYAVGVEHIPELVQQSIENVKRSKATPLLESGHLSFHVADGRQGWPEQGPYDAIHVGAAASSVPQALVNQLKPGGRLVIPVGDVFQDLVVIDKKPDGSLQVGCATSVRYVPLTSRDEQLSY